MNLDTLFQIFKKKHKLIKLINASKLFLKLKNIHDPEKEKFIGNLFIKVFKKSPKN